MNFWQKIIENIKGSEDFSELKSSSFRDILNGNILNKKFITKQYRLFAMIVLLFIFYINNRYTVESLVYEEVELRKELQDVKFESLTISAKLTEMSRRTYVLDHINKRGLDLQESPYPPVKIAAPNPKKDKIIIEEKEEHKAATERINRDTTINEEYIEQ